MNSFTISIIHNYINHTAHIYPNSKQKKNQENTHMYNFTTHAHVYPLHGVHNWFMIPRHWLLGR